ncbi:Uncharacterised protein [Streptococcus agalactiae]|nr:Uncharacterised protein [Streptococcus agalactiae]
MKSSVSSPGVKVNGRTGEINRIVTVSLFTAFKDSIR